MDRRERAIATERAPTERAPTGRRPNLVIAGVSRAGTTSLFHYLGQHPEICGSDVKELRYFAPLRHGGELSPIGDLTRHFQHWAGQRYAMEATPGYFYGGARLARGLREICPGVHVLVSLRSPVERCWSWYRFSRGRLRLPEDMSFDAYLDRCEELHRAGVDGDLEHQPFWGLGGGCYDTWFDAWVEAFGPRFRLVIFEDLTRDPAGVSRDICRWLGLDETVVSGFDLSVENRSEHYRDARLQGIAVAVNRRAEAFFRRHRAVKRWMRSAYFTVNRRPMPDVIPPEARARLEEFYRPHNARLAARLASAGMAIPAWAVDVS